MLTSFPEHLNSLIQHARRSHSHDNAANYPGLTPICPLNTTFDPVCLGGCNVYPTCSKQWADAQFLQATQRYQSKDNEFDWPHEAFIHDPYPETEIPIQPSIKLEAETTLQMTPPRTPEPVE